MLVIYSFQSLIFKIDMKFSQLMFISWKEYEVPQFSKDSSSVLSCHIFIDKIYFPQERIAEELHCVQENQMRVDYNM